MKYYRIFFITLIFLSYMNCETSHKKEVKNGTSEVSEITSETLKLMTYNIRLDVASDGENAWPNRKDILTSQVLFLAPDIMGVQEARPNQMEDLRKALKDYKSVGVGRDGENEGEFSAIFYNSKKISVENEATFWLSETPNEISKGWDAAYPRICTYGLFTATNTGQKFWVFNTHLDHVGAEAQKEGMKLILRKIDKINVKGFPVVIMGDFNVEPNSHVIAETQSKMVDAKAMAKVKFGNNGTFNGFKYAEIANRRIDYILISKSSNVEVEKYAVLTSAVDLKFPSDHFPVLVELKIK